MSTAKVSPNVAYNQNLTVLASALELGAAAITQVMGDEAISNQILGETQKTRDIQEMLASRLVKQLGV